MIRGLLIFALENATPLPSSHHRIFPYKHSEKHHKGLTAIGSAEYHGLG